MGEPTGRSTRRFESADLIARTKQPIVAEEPAATDDDDPLADWDQGEAAVAVGSQPEALPTTSRTATLMDPLTTGLLAEVARRTQTMEYDPDTVAAATRNTQEIDVQVLERAIRESQRMPAITDDEPKRKIK
jgi:hypothetical protein